MLKQINALQWLAYADVPLITPDITPMFVVGTKMHLPSQVQLFTTCEAPDYSDKPRVRQAENIMHGKRRRAQAISGQFQPRYTAPGHAVWRLSPPCDAAPQAQFWLADPTSTPPEVHWSSLVYPCANIGGPDDFCYLEGELFAFTMPPEFKDFSFQSGEFTGSPLHSDAIRIYLPPTGSFDACAALQWYNLDPGARPSIRMVIEGPGADIIQSPPFVDTGTAAAGNIVITTRRKIQGPGTTVRIQAAGYAHDEVDYKRPDNFFWVSWWETDTYPKT